MLSGAKIFSFHLSNQQLTLNLARTEAFVTGIQKAHFSARCSAWHGTLTEHQGGVNKGDKDMRSLNS
jgi:hypothetical protein